MSDNKKPTKKRANSNYEEDFDTPQRPSTNIPRPNKDYGCFCNFVLNLLINIANVVTLFIPYFIISKMTGKDYHKENKETRGSSFKFYGKPVENKVVPFSERTKEERLNDLSV